MLPTTFKKNLKKPRNSWIYAPGIVTPRIENKLTAQIDMFNVDFITGAETKIPLDDSLVNEAISYYQTASYLIKKGYMKSDSDYKCA